MNTQAEEVDRLWTQKLVLWSALCEIRHGCKQVIKEADLQTIRPSVCPYKVIDIIDKAISIIQKGDKDVLG